MSINPPNIQKSELDLVSEITKNIAKNSVAQEDLALAEYVNKICTQMENVGEDLKNYMLVRTSAFGIEGSLVQYSIEKKQ